MVRKKQNIAMFGYLSKVKTHFVDEFWIFLHYVNVKALKRRSFFDFKLHSPFVHFVWIDSGIYISQIILNHWKLLCWAIRFYFEKQNIDTHFSKNSYYYIFGHWIWFLLDSENDFYVSRWSSWSQKNTYSIFWWTLQCLKFLKLISEIISPQTIWQTWRMSKHLQTSCRSYDN